MNVKQAFNKWFIERTGADPELVDCELEEEAFIAGVNYACDRWENSLKRESGEVK